MSERNLASGISNLELEDTSNLPKDSLDGAGIDWVFEASTNPSQLPELTRMEANAGGSAASLLSGGVLSPGRKTMKDYEQQQKALEEENFKLKLRIYMLEERMQGQNAPEATNNATIVDLKVQVATQRDELAQKKALLRRAAETLETLERQYGAELEQQQRDSEAERHRLEDRIAELQAQLEQTALAEQSVGLPYLKAFEPLAVDHALCHTADELRQLNDKVAALQTELAEMKQTAEERERESGQLRRQLDEARSEAARLTERAEQAERSRQQAERSREQLAEQLQQLRDQPPAQDGQQQQAELQARVEELQSTCDQLQAGRTADAARIAELEHTVSGATEQLRRAVEDESTLHAALKSVGAQLVERKTELTASRRAQKRSAAHIQTLIAEVRRLQQALREQQGPPEPQPQPAAAAKGAVAPAAGASAAAAGASAGAAAAGGASAVAAAAGGAAAAGASAAAAGASAGAAAAAGASAAAAGASAGAEAARTAGAAAGVTAGPEDRAGEVEVFLLRAESQRKDKKIRRLAAKLRQTSDSLVQSRWGAKEQTEAENERLWTELEENKKLISEVQKEKMELVLEKETQIKRLLSELKSRSGGAAEAGGITAFIDRYLSQSADGDAELQQARHEAAELRADAERAAVTLQQTQAEVESLRAQLALTTLLGKDREAQIGRLKERLVTADGAELDGVLETQQAESERLQRTLADREQKLAAAERRVAELSETLAARDRELTLAEGQLNEIAELRDQLEERDQRLAAADGRLAGTTAELEAARAQREASERRLAAADGELQERARQLEERDARLAAAEGELAERDGRLTELEARLEEKVGQLTAMDAELEEKTCRLAAADARLAEIVRLLAEAEEERDRRLTEADALRAELRQARGHVSERDAENAELLRRLQADTRKAGEADRLRRRLAETRAAAQMLQRRLQELADFLELLIRLGERGALDLSCLTARHVADLQRSLAESRELSQSLTQSMLLAAGEELDLSGAEMSSLHVPELGETLPGSAADQSSLHVPPLDQSAAPPPAADAVFKAPAPVAAAKASCGAETRDAAVQSDGPPSVPPAPVTADTGSQASAGREAELRQTLARRDAELETLQARLETYDMELLQRERAIDELTRQVATLRAAPQTDAGEQQTDAGERPQDGDGTPPERADSDGSGSPAGLPQGVRARFQQLVRRQRSCDGTSGAETAPAADRSLQRALSPLLSAARAQSAHLLGLQSPRRHGRAGRPAQPERGSSGSGTAREARPSPRSAHKAGRTRSHEVAPASAALPAAGDFSESEAWSEPDRDVSLARIGLDHDSLGTRTESWLAGADGKRSRRRQKVVGGQEAQEQLEAHIEDVNQVRSTLKAKVDVYQQGLPSSGGMDKQEDSETAQSGVLVPTEVLSEISNLQEQLEKAIAAHHRVRRQMEARTANQTPNDELALALKITQEELAETSEKLAASQRRCDEQRSKLNRAKESLRQAQLTAEEFKDKFVRVSEDMVRLRERIKRLETGRGRPSEESVRRRAEQEDVCAQCRQPPPPPSDGEQPLDASGPLHASLSESQLLALNREKLRLVSERRQLAVRSRLLRSESCLLDGEAGRAAAETRRLEAERRLEAAKWVGWERERARLQAEVERLAAAAQAAPDAALREEHSHCERRLAELTRQNQADRRRLAEVSAQLEEVNAEMEAMRNKLGDLDDGGQAESCPESTRSCDLPAAPSTPADQGRRTSESDGHDPLHESDRTSAYSSPDLGIESDCNRAPSRSSHAARRTQGHEPECADSETQRLRRERDEMHSRLVATRGALQQALDKLSRADQRKARVERAICRQLSKTHDILVRAKRNLAPPADREPTH